MKFKIFLIIGLAFLLRFINLGNIPPGISHDELENINNGISIWKTGRDLNGDFLPITVGGLGLVVLPAYLAGLSALLFGQTISGARTLAVALGAANVFFLYLIAKKLINEKTAVIAALLYAISPWGIHFSRMMFDPPVALFFLLSSFAFFLSTKSKYQPLSLSLLGLALISYYGYIFVIPLIVILFIWFKKEEIKKKNLFSGLLILFVFGLVFFGMLTSPGKTKLSGGRSSELIFFQNEKISEKVIYERSTSQAPDALNKLFINKGTVILSEITGNYLSAFNPENIFLFGEASNILSPRNTGFLYLIELPLIIIGAYALYKKDKKTSAFIFLVILISPVTMALSDERTYAARVSLMFPFLLLLAANGLSSLINKSTYKILFLFFYILSVSAFLFQYFFRYPIYAKEIWFDSERQVSEYLINNPNKDIVVATTEPRETFMEHAFFGKLSGRKMQMAYKVEAPIFVDRIMFSKCLSPAEKPKDTILILDSECHFDLTHASEYIKSQEGADQIKWGIFKDQ